MPEQPSTFAQTYRLQLRNAEGQLIDLGELTVDWPIRFEAGRVEPLLDGAMTAFADAMEEVLREIRATAAAQAEARARRA